MSSDQRACFKVFRLIVVLAIGFYILPRSASAQSGTVVVNSYQLYNDSDHYGVKFTVTNTTGTYVCAFPYPYNQDNVAGAVDGEVQLNTGDTDIYIGTFTRDDERYGWGVDVGAKWKEGQCS